MKNDVQFPADVSFSEEHTWVLVEENTGLIGLSDYGQSELGEIVYVELPDVGDSVNQGSPFGTIEAMKTVIELISPLSGQVIEVNPVLEDDSKRINIDPYNDGWLIKIDISDVSETEMLLTGDEYREIVIGDDS